MLNINILGNLKVGFFPPLNRIKKNQGAQKMRNNTKLIEKLNHRISELETENKFLIAKVQKYEAIIDETAKAKTKYEECSKACRELSAEYISSIKKARETKHNLEEQMEKEIANFRKHSRMLLKDTK